MRKLKLFFIRKTKALYLFFRLHYLFSPFENIFFNLAYLNRFSRWHGKHRNQGQTDFFSWKFDYKKRYDLYEYLIESQKLQGPIDYLEFGVAAGLSVRWWVSHNTHPDSRFVGFDTFTGLPEKWKMFKAGEMTNEGQFPVVNDERCSFEAGLFQQTVPKFLEKYIGDRAAIYHMDADLYSSTLYVLTSLAIKLKKGDIIIFDEFGVPTHEFRAFQDFMNSYYLKFEVLAANNNYYQVAIKLI